jgi:glycosyltransferase involved in cell wall biosynthesis
MAPTQSPAQNQAQSQAQSQPAADNRPVMAVVTGTITPYRVHFHKRLAREVKELKLATLITHEAAHGLWNLGDIPELNIHEFGEAQAAKGASRVDTFKRELAKARRLRAWLDANPVKVLVCIGYNEMPFLAALSWAREHGIPCYIWTDSNARSEKAHGLKKLSKKIFIPGVAKGCTGVFCCGSFGKEYFLSYGVPESKIFISPYEPDYDQIDAIPREYLDEIAAKFRLDPTRKRIVACSRLIPVKRVDQAIDAFARLAGQRPDWDLLIVGDGPLAGELKARVPEALRGRVQFTGFVGDQKVVSALYRASHVMVHPSIYEPWALVINEAVAAGLAIVTTDVVGAAAELVRDKVNGRIYRAGDLDALSECLLDATDAATCAGYRAQARPVLSDWRRVADPVEGFRIAFRAAGLKL